MRFTILSEKPAPNPKSRSFEKSGRMFLVEDNLRIVIDGIGMYDISRNGVRVVLLGLGDCPVYSQRTLTQCGTANLSESSRGFYLMIEGRTYVTPAERVRKVLSGDHKKAPVFLIRDAPLHLHGGDATN